jgi:hypothetical protein
MQTMSLAEFRQQYERTGKGWRTKTEADKAAKQNRADTDWVATLLEQIKQAGSPEPVREHRFHNTRRWRLDLAWPSLLVACEVDGGVYAQGRHTRGKGFEEDCRKYNEAATLGWLLLRVTPGLIEQGEVLPWLHTAVAIRQGGVKHEPTAV